MSSSELPEGISASCRVAEDTFFEREWVSFHSEKYASILALHNTDEYGPDEAIATICRTAEALGEDPELVIETWWRNDFTGETKDKTQKIVRWSEYKNSL